jgi:GT2 family glycosyltransferase
MIPASNRAEHLQALCHSLETLNPQPNLFIFSENNSADGTLNIIREFAKRHPTEIIRLWFREDAFETGNPYIPIAHIRDTLISAARQFNPEYAIFLDSDMIVQSPNLIHLLTRWKRDIVAAFLTQTTKNGKQYTNAVRGDLETGFHRIEIAENGLTEISATGMGCTCFSRRLLQDRQISFYPPVYITWLNDRRYEFYAEDHAFCLKARQLGYHIYLDGTAKVTHNQHADPRPWQRAVDSTWRLGVGANLNEYPIKPIEIKLHKTPPPAWTHLRDSQKKFR